MLLVTLFLSEVHTPTLHCTRRDSFIHKKRFLVTPKLRPRQFVTKPQVTASMSSFTAEELLTESVKYLMEDEVCLDTAMRNLIAKVFGIYSTQDRSVSFSKNNSPDIVYKDIMTSARFILQAFNSHSLIPYEEWAEANSQLEDTTADSRFKQLIDYKGAHYLRTKFEGKKLSKALGRRYLQATNLWDAVVLPAAQAAAAQSNVESNVFLFFSTEFGLSLQGNYDLIVLLLLDFLF